MPENSFVSLRTNLLSIRIQVTSTHFWASLVAQMVKNLPTMQEIWVQSLRQEDPLEKWQPTPVFLPRQSCVQRSLVGCRLCDRTETQLKQFSSSSSSSSNTFTEHLQGALSYACELPQGRNRPAPGPLELTDLSPNLFTYLCQPPWLGYDSRDLGQPSSLLYLVHH